jgi:predicted nucleic acid-binding protein
MSASPHYVIYDCVVFTQALINPNGPCGECVNLARQARVRLFVSEYVINEIRELDGKIPAKYSVTSQQVNDLADQVALFGIFVPDVPTVYGFPFLPDRWHYENLAVETKSDFIVSRDRHLLNLMEPVRTDGEDFRRRFPSISILTPESFLQMLRAKERD